MCKENQSSVGRGPTCLSEIASYNLQINPELEYVS
jgi:hypothetical protein